MAAAEENDETRRTYNNRFAAPSQQRDKDPASNRFAAPSIDDDSDSEILELLQSNLLSEEDDADEPAELAEPPDESEAPKDTHGSSHGGNSNGSVSPRPQQHTSRYGGILPCSHVLPRNQHNGDSHEKRVPTTLLRTIGSHP
jgi:hypothetical protein